MSESEKILSDLPDDESAALPEQAVSDETLPPVVPPSAGFILQLFIVPAVIVIAVVGIYMLFGVLASSDQDWQSLVAELRSSNEHRRWRGAHGLAQMLQADARRGEEGQQLASNPSIAAELAGLMEEELTKNSNRKDDINRRSFLARALGWLDAPDVVLPVLQSAMQDDQDEDVRKNSIAAIAQIAGRASDKHQTFAAPSLSESLIAVSSDSSPLMRQLSAYVLGLMPGEKSQDRLTLMLQDGDDKTRLNAAIGLARQKSASGFGVFLDVLQNADRVIDPADMVGETQQERIQLAHAVEFEHFVALKNTLMAVKEISDQLSDPRQKQMVDLITPIADGYREPKIRIEAKSALLELQ